MTSKSKILDFLSPHTLEELYEGHQEGILLVLSKKIITGGLVRLSLVPGKGMLVARIEDLDTEELAESRPLPDHKTHPVLRN